MEWQANILKNAQISKALALNAAEERRHKEVLHNMLTFYKIELGPEPVYLPPRDPEFGFLRTGFGECINSFFDLRPLRHGADIRLLPTGFGRNL